MSDHETERAAAAAPAGSTSVPVIAATTSVDDPARAAQLAALHRVWKEVRDPATGDVYYWNTENGKTSWKNPFRLPGDASESEDEEEESEDEEQEEQSEKEDRAATKGDIDDQDKEHRKDADKSRGTTQAFPYYPPQQVAQNVAPSAHAQQGHVQHAQPHRAYPPRSAAAIAMAQRATANASRLDALLDSIDATAPAPTPGKQPIAEGDTITNDISANAAFDQAALDTTPSMPAELQHYHHMQQQQKLHEQQLQESMLAHPELYAPLQQPAAFETYSAVGQFNVKTGAFQGVASGAGGGAMGMSRKQRRAQQTSDVKDINKYFNYHAWVEERNAEDASASASASATGGPVRGKGPARPSRDDLAKFKAKKEERKKQKQRWLFED